MRPRGSRASGTKVRVTMAFDPQREDYQRLALRYAATLDATDPASANRAFANFGRRFAQDRDSLPQSDGDRAFHLVAVATQVIDYQLPFSDDTHALQLIDRGHKVLDEALALDPDCFDARRMQAAASTHSFEDFYVYLAEGAEEVRRRCSEERDQSARTHAGERAQLAATIAMRPYHRWQAARAEQALICGRNREAIAISQELLSLDPDDAADVRFTCALAYAKLEDEASLDALAKGPYSRARRAADDGWMRLSRIAIAHRAHRMDEARRHLRAVAGTYPYGAETLIRQSELPDGVFARLAAMPYSEDELILAVSEGTVLLQEGRDSAGRGVLGSWIANELSAMYPNAAANVMHELNEMNRGRGGMAGGDASNDLGEGGRG